MDVVIAPYKQCILVTLYLVFNTQNIGLLNGDSVGMLILNFYCLLKIPLSHNQIIVRFASTAHPNLDFKNPTFLEWKILLGTKQLIDCGLISISNNCHGYK